MDKLTSIHEYSDYLHSQKLMSMSDRWKLLRKRLDFGRRKIKLWMFFPCKLVEGEWFILEEPEGDHYMSDEQGMAKFDYLKYKKDSEEYQQAKDNVLFDGFKYKSKGYVTNGVLDFDEESIENLKIEDLVKYNLELTQVAKKQLGL